MTGHESSTATTLSVRTLVGYLLGRREAISRVAGCRGALWLGLALVMMAGLAREYDGADLLSEPWHLLLPLAASLATSFVLFVLLFAAARWRRAADLSFIGGYRTFLTFYWLTAPLAWVYAIPVEQFLTPGAAVAANLCLLGGVSLWRVSLITHVVSVWLNASWAVILWIVLFFADTVLLALTYTTPTPIWDAMGGVRLSQAEETILMTKLVIGSLAHFAWPVCLVVALISVIVRRLPWQPFRVGDGRVTLARSSVVAPVAVLIALLCALPWAQPQQRRATHAKRLLQSGQLTEAVAYMSQFDRSAFPPVWDPPPRIGYGERTPDLKALVTHVQGDDVRPWVRRLFIGKFVDWSPAFLYKAIQHREEIDEEAIVMYLDVVKFADEHIAPSLEALFQLRDAASRKDLDPGLKQRIQDYLSKVAGD